MLFDSHYIYSHYILPNVNNYYFIEFKSVELQGVIDLTRRVSKKKELERNYLTDNRKIHTRFMTGFMGELAVENLLGFPIIDYRDGISSRFNYPDIKQKNIGIKTVKFGTLPLIPKRNFYPQIICIRWNINTIAICGVATSEILNNFGDEAFVLDRQLKKLNLKKKNSGNEDKIKVAFTGFNNLIPIRKYFNI